MLHSTYDHDSLYILVKGSSYMSTAKVPHMSNYSSHNQCCITDSYVTITIAYELPVVQRTF